MLFTDCNMTLGEKLRYLREIEGALRGLDRDISQVELARLIQKELGKSISQSYLSQIESGARPHLTNSTRMLLARFFKVHPGYLVDDPEGFQNELLSDLGVTEDKLDLWLIGGAERFLRDVDLHHALVTVAKHSDSRMCLIVLGEILENPGLAERLIEVLRGPAPAPISATTRLGASGQPLADARGSDQSRDREGAVPRKSTESRGHRTSAAPAKKPRKRS